MSSMKMQRHNAGSAARDPPTSTWNNSTRSTAPGGGTLASCGHISSSTLQLRYFCTGSRGCRGSRRCRRARPRAHRGRRRGSPDNRPRSRRRREGGGLAVSSSHLDNEQRRRICTKKLDQIPEGWTGDYCILQQMHPWGVLIDFNSATFFHPNSKISGGRIAGIICSTIPDERRIRYV